MSKKQIINAGSSWGDLSLKEVYDYRHLIKSLAWRDIKVKYAQTLIGVLWAVLQPTITILILTFVFQRVASISIEIVPPLLYIFSGYLSWSYFSNIVSRASDSIVDAQDMIQKIYFPKLVLPLSKAISCIIELIVVFCLLVALLIYYDYPISTNIFFFPLILFINLLFSVSFAIWISSLTIRYRDFRFITPFFLQLGIFITPIAYPVSNVPEMFRHLYFLNPLVGLIEATRWSVLSIGEINISLGYSILVTLLLLFSGLLYFSKIDKTIADII